MEGTNTFACAHKIGYKLQAGTERNLVHTKWIEMCSGHILQEQLLQNVPTTHFNLYRLTHSLSSAYNAAFEIESIFFYFMTLNFMSYVVGEEKLFPATEL